MALLQVMHQLPTGSKAIKNNMAIFQTVGVMQGRLLPKYLGRYQAHPLCYWQNEFDIARSIGLSSIEFILDYNDAEQNPLLSPAGLNEIRSITKKSGVKVLSVCADYFMEAPLHDSNEKSASESLKVLLQLVKNCSVLGVTDIVIPCVDQSSLQGKQAVERFVEQLNIAIPEAERCHVNLSLETDLDPYAFSKLLERFPSSNVTVNYDTGNSASLGYNPVEELNCYGERISDLHIKDRKYKGGSVVLGTGDTDFKIFFEAFEKLNYKGIVIMQAFRDEEGVSIFKQQLDWLKTNYLK